MTNRRIFLLLVTTLSAADLLWLIDYYNSELKVQELVLYMPELEAFQNQHPDNLLSSSHFWDERLPVDVVIADSTIIGKTSLFERLYGCKPVAVRLENRSLGGLPQMPPRYTVFVNGESKVVRNCVASVLPRGFQIMERTG